MDELRFFKYKHLPDKLQVTSAYFAVVAEEVVNNLPPSEERAMCLRKLLEAKDCAVRAALDTP